MEVIPTNTSSKESKESLTLDPLMIVKKELIEPRRLILKARKAIKKNQQTSQRIPTVDEENNDQSQQFENIREITGLNIGEGARSLVMTGTSISQVQHNEAFRKSM